MKTTGTNRNLLPRLAPAGAALTGAALIALALTAGAMTASADVKPTYSSYTGLFCKSWSDSAVFHYSKAKVRNGSDTYEIGVECPIVRRNLDAGLDAGSRAVVRDANANTGKNVVCTLKGRHSGGSLAYSTAETSGGGASGVQTLVFDALPASSTYSLGCELPPTDGSSSELRSYRIYESDSTW